MRSDVPSDLQLMKSKELQRFSDNAAGLLLREEKLAAFFTHIRYEVEPHQDGLRGLCPACLNSFCFIGLNGRHHKVYWKCFNGRCDSNSGKGRLYHNLLGLVQGILADHSLGRAIKVISAFLGYEGR